MSESHRASQRPIQFYYRGQIRQAQDLPNTRTVLQHLREDLHCTGIKEGCAEGDCGACTVVVGELRNGRLELNTVNACIQFLPTLDGKALFTVEDLKQPDGSLHPVQQAMVDCHGSQCGFCTPGFVMSLWGLYLKHEQDGIAPGKREIDDALSGNLCRCTGYRPIVDAARRMGQLPGVRFDRAQIAQALRTLHAAQGDAPLAVSHGGQTFHAPRTLAQLARLRSELPLARILAGSTDVGLWVTKQMRELGDIVYIGQVDELRRMEVKDGWLEIGAGVSLEQAYAEAHRYYPQELSELWQRFASLPVRHAGTLGGNVANGSPIGDSMPWLIALGAQIVLYGVDGQRVMPLEAFYLAYQKSALAANEVVQAVRIPLPRAQVKLRIYKLSKRFDQDISAVCAAFAFRFDEGKVSEARICYGGMAATPKRAASAEAVLNGQDWSEDNVHTAMAALAQDYAPLSDMRASAAYRLRTAQNLLYRYWLETRPEAPLAADAVRAFAVTATCA